MPAPEREKHILHDLPDGVVASHLVVRKAPQRFVMLPEDLLEDRLVAGADAGDQVCVARGLVANVDVQVGIGRHGALRGTTASRSLWGSDRTILHTRSIKALSFGNRCRRLLVR